ncbi:MAG: chorismate-binding protein, partial [Desulfomicrobium escambiense]|nr:chorismate-binding protein [Desulfomicrobium escambiense]
VCFVQLRIAKVKQTTTNRNPTSTFLAGNPGGWRMAADRTTHRRHPPARRRPRSRIKRLEAELLADPKELAEHLMLIDLGPQRRGPGQRKPAGVRLTETAWSVERYSHVMHIVSNVTRSTARPAEPQSTHCAPLSRRAPSSGAPKIRAPWRSSTSWSRSSAVSTPARSAICPGPATWTPAIAIRTAVLKRRDAAIFRPGVASWPIPSRPMNGKKP